MAVRPASLTVVAHRVSSPTISTERIVSLLEIRWTARLFSRFPFLTQKVTSPLLGSNVAIEANNFLILPEPSGSFSINETSDGNGIGWFSVDTNGTLRTEGSFDGSGESV